MYIDDIFNPKYQVLTVEQMSYSVEWFIQDKLGQNVSVNFYRGCLNGRRVNPLLVKVELKKLIKAYAKALEHYHLKNNC